MSDWNTKVKICSIPEFLIGNGNQIEFDTLEEQLNYFESKKVAELEYLNLSYMRTNGGTARLPINADKLTALAPNWILFQNSDFGDKWFIANILQIYYINPNCSEITYSVDSFQTYMHDIDKSKPVYIARRTWSGKNDNDNELMQLPFEDIDVGNDYIIADASFDFNDSDKSYKTDQFYYLLMTKALTSSGSSHEIITGSKTISYKQGDKTIQATTENGQNSVLYGYIMNYSLLNHLMNNGVFQSDCSIVNALKLVVQLPFGRSMFPSGITNLKDRLQLEKPITPPVDGELYDQREFGNLRNEVEIKDWCSRLNDYINKIMKNDMNAPFDDSVPTSAIGKYLYRYPYSLIETYDFYNQPDTIRIENLNRLNQFESIRSKILKIQKYGAIGQNPMLVYCIKGVKNNGTSKDFNDLTTIDNIYAITDTNFNILQATTSLPIISDFLSSFLQANMNQINATRANLRDTLSTQMSNLGASLQAQATSIALQRTNAMLAAKTQATNANLQTQANLTAQIASINASREADKINNVTALGNSELDAVGMAGAGTLGVIGGIVTHNPLAMAAGGMGVLGSLSHGVKSSLNYAAAETTSSMMAKTNRANANLMANASTAATANTLSAAAQIAANNSAASNAQAQATFGNGVRSASTSYNNEIRAINARIEDAKNVPASVQTMGNNASIFNTLFNRDIIKVSTKTLPPEVMKRLVDYFIFNGFITNKLDNLKTIKEKFTNDPGYFIQTINCNISGKIPLEALQAIKDMYDGGVYLWKKDQYMNYDKMKEV